MSNIPEDVKQKISDKAEIESRSRNFSGGFKINRDLRFGFIGGGLYGYSLALPKIEELEKKVEEQQGVINMMNKVINKQLEIQKEQAKEIEFLKKCISDLNYFIA